MNDPIRALFVTYAFVGDPKDFEGVTNSPNTPVMIGVLKRCLRLIRHLPADTVEVHWVHYGGLDESDPLVREMSPHISRYTEPRYAESGVVPDAFRRYGRLRRGVQNGCARLDRVWAWVWPRGSRKSMAALLRRLRPDVIVYGENPLGGQLQVISQLAQEQGLVEVAIDNDLSRLHTDALLQGSPQIAGWFLLGLGVAEAPDGPAPRLVVGPPLLAEGGSDPPDTAADVTILGYDPGVREQGIRFLRECPAGTVGRLVSPPLDPRERRECERQSGAARLVFASLPDEREYRALLESSRIVFCKNGFQQMVESLALGTPVIAWEAEGGVMDFTLDGAMQPFVKFLPPTPAAWSEALALARKWLVARPAMPWTREIEKLACPARTGAEMFAGFLHNVVAARDAREARWNPGS